MKQAYQNLPEGYELVLTVDPMEKKTALWLNIAALIPTLFGYGAVLVLFFQSAERSGWGLLQFMAPFIAFLLLMVLYIPLHELVHGLIYKLMTGKKLTFGFNGIIAWCGIPDWYVSRKTALWALAGPFVVFTVLFGFLIFTIQPLWLKYAMVLMLGMHIGSCAGDLYDLWLLLFRYRSSQLLMKDPGPLQFFYLPEKEAQNLKNRPEQGGRQQSL